VKRSRKVSRQVQQPLFAGVPVERSDEAIQRQVMAAVDKEDAGNLPREVIKAFTLEQIHTNDLEIDGLYFDDRDRVVMATNTFRTFAQRAMAAGFIAALVKYRKQLAAVPALSRFYSRQTQGQRRGHDAQSKRRITRAQEAVAMAKAGCSVADIVTHFRNNGMTTCDRSTVYRWLKVKRLKR
jgi:hypothetical protein